MGNYEKYKIIFIYCLEINCYLPVYGILALDLSISLFNIFVPEEKKH